MCSDAIRYGYNSTYSDATQVVLADDAFKRDDFLSNFEKNGFSRVDIYQKPLATHLTLGQIGLNKRP